MLAGNVVALLTPLITVPILSFVFRSPKYDWVSMRTIRKGDDTDLATAAHMDIEQIPGQATHTAADDEAEEKHLLRAAKIARSLTVALVLCFLILWPMPMYGSGYIFSKKFFTGWVVVGILWLFVSSFCVGLYPLFEGRKTMKRTFVAIWKDVTGKGRVTHGRATVAETAEVEEEKEERKLEKEKEQESEAQAVKTGEK